MKYSHRHSDVRRPCRAVRGRADRPCSVPLIGRGWLSGHLTRAGRSVLHVSSPRRRACSVTAAPSAGPRHGGSGSEGSPGTPVPAASTQVSRCADRFEGLGGVRRAGEPAAVRGRPGSGQRGTATPGPPGDAGARAPAKRESLPDGGVPGRGPTQPIAPYGAINYSAEVSISEDGINGYSSGN